MPLKAAPERGGGTGRHMTGRRIGASLAGQLEQWPVTYLVKRGGPRVDP